MHKSLLMPAVAALFGLAACGGEEAEVVEEPAMELEAPAVEAPIADEGIGEGGLVDDEVMEPGLDADGDGILDSEETEAEGVGY